MIEEQFVGYETAKMLKEAGFDEWCCYGYNKDGNKTPISLRNSTIEEMFNSTGNEWYVSAPTQALAARWLREVHNLHVYAIQTNLPLTEPQTTEWKWGYIIAKVDDPNGQDNFIDMYYTSYEDAMEAGIRLAIESVIDKQGK